ncbi:MAG TPA: aminoacetone oxidase family FAD-binding enzyme, partial [Comamonas denitrificans]|nr:aminoacetone oxidase family FAD-binding enzyme [Comamonas denitrificans]
MPYFDVVIVGAGAAGLFCAAQAGQRGLRVLLIDHAERVAEKIRISGGGRCNFTNRHLDPRTGHQHYLGQNPQFARSALSRFTPQHFIDLVEKNGIAFHEKHKGQLFADRSAQDIVRMLLDACALAGVQRWQPCTIETIEAEAASAPRSGPSRYRLHTSQGLVQAHNLVVATGGLSIPKIGATDFGYRIAKQFGLPIVAQRPGLVPLRFAGEDWAPYADLAGVALPVRISTGEKKATIAFDEDLLFTHRGLSGPAILQISSYWQPGQPLTIDLLPHLDIAAALQEAKASSKKQLPNLLA